MKVSVFSQRNVKGYESIIETTMEEWLQSQDTTCITVLTGGAQGAQSVLFDALSDVWDFVVFRPWTQISRRLEIQATKEGKFDPVWFFFRNIQIVDNSDVVIIFDTGEKDAEVYKVRELCKRKGKELVEFSLQDEQV